MEGLQFTPNELLVLHIALDNFRKTLKQERSMQSNIYQHHLTKVVEKLADLEDEE